LLPVPQPREDTFNLLLYPHHSGEIIDKITIGPMPYMSVMPIVLVGANVNGKANYMTAGAATVACMAPPMVCVALNKARYTVKGIEENKTFSLNVPSVDHLVEADYCGIVSGAQEDKSKVCTSLRQTEDRAPGGGVPGQHRMPTLQSRGLREPPAPYRRSCGGLCR
jgi:hypothetical protein